MDCISWNERVKERIKGNFYDYNTLWRDYAFTIWLVLFSVPRKRQLTKINSRMTDQMLPFSKMGKFLLRAFYILSPKWTLLSPFTTVEARPTGLLLTFRRVFNFYLFAWHLSLSALHFWYIFYVSHSLFLNCKFSNENNNYYNSKKFQRQSMYWNLGVLEVGRGLEKKIGKKSFPFVPLTKWVVL